jgi:hypothetical protein
MRHHSSSLTFNDGSPYMPSFYMVSPKQRTSILADWKNIAKNELNKFRLSIDIDPDQPVSLMSIYKADHLINKIPRTIESPYIGLEGSGHILLEWYRGSTETRLSIVLETDGYVFSMRTKKNAFSHGCLSYTDGSISMLIDLLRTHFHVENGYETSSIH